MISELVRDKNCRRPFQGHIQEESCKCSGCCRDAIDLNCKSTASDHFVVERNYFKRLLDILGLARLEDHEKREGRYCSFQDQEGRIYENDFHHYIADWYWWEPSQWGRELFHPGRRNNYLPRFSRMGRLGMGYRGMKLELKAQAVALGRDCMLSQS